MVCVHSSGRGYRFARLRFKPLCPSLRCKITGGWLHSVCSQQESLEPMNKVRAGHCDFPGLSLPGLGLSNLVTGVSFPTSSLTLSRKSAVFTKKICVLYEYTSGHLGEFISICQ